LKKHLVISLNKTLTKIWENKKITLLHQKVKQGRNRTCKPGSVENSDLSWLYVAIQLAPPFGTRRAAALFLLVLLRIGFTWQYSRLYSGELLPRLSILAKKIFWRFLSVALSLESPRPAVSRYPALWSPDFPHSLCCAAVQSAPGIFLLYRI